MKHHTSQFDERHCTLLETLAFVVVASFAALTLPSEAYSAERCEFAGFQCRFRGEVDPATGEQIVRMIDLKGLRAGKRSDRWIAKYCRPDHLAPEGCDWRASSGGAGGAPPTYDAPSYAAPAYREPADDGAAAPAAPAPVRRDAWGRRTPTPAPREVEGGSPSASAQIEMAADSGAYAAEIAAAAARYKLPSALLRAVLTVESGGNIGAVSHKGARGLMQLMPATAKALGVTDVDDPAQNIMGGARFLRILANRFQGDLVKVLSAYHAGSLRVLTRDGTPFAATDEYVRKVLRVYYQLRDQAARRG